MSKDPFLERETKKYAFPVPSRECILALLSKTEKPISRKELAKALDISDNNKLEGFHRRLRAMERDGQLVFTRRQRYMLPERLDLGRGIVIGHRDGYGFLRVEDKKDDYYLSIEQMKMVIHGDVVMAHLQSADRKGRREARIIRILVPKISSIVGRFFTDSGNFFIVPEDNRLNFKILIPPEETRGAKKGYIVVVELIKRQTRDTKAIGKVIEVLGNEMNIKMAVDIALRTHNVPYVWSQEIERELNAFKDEIPESAKLGRVDLRSLPLITIDDEDACDFDDAVYCEKKHGGGWRLWVAIADVSYYVRPSTFLDQEASRRSTSVYFPSQVIPMLPEILSNVLCSLNAQTDRLCMICEMNVSKQGRLLSYKFYEAMMHSHARLTYKKVWQILKGDQKLRDQYVLLINPIMQLHKMYQSLEQARLQRGGLLFETEEAKFILNEDSSRIERIDSTKRNDAHKLIEECMILANIAAARFVEKNREPILYRVHDRPSIDYVTSLRAVLGKLGLSLGGGQQPTPRDYADIIDVISDRPDYEMLQTMLLRSMKQASYDSENRGHFGLALQSYVHFTSPIRRYPDLVLHRTIKYLLNRQSCTIKGYSDLTSGWYHYELEDILRLAQQCSTNERRADEVTRNVSDWLKCDFIQDHIGTIFNGVITNVTGFGFFVRLNKLFIDGLVHISSLDNDYYRYDNACHQLVGEYSGRLYQLGDIVTIRVEAVHMDQRKIDFSLVSVN
ncbi:ribonuclease R [Candidatus Curculioniphilus buchneri]|uniref:ribonuclease R n=1 Tax=Candidatus Curculioniphilus buchneri TaxID=690594 RepID=UPI00376EF21E